MELYSGLRLSKSSPGLAAAFLGLSAEVVVAWTTGAFSLDLRTGLSSCLPGAPACPAARGCRLSFANFAKSFDCMQPLKAYSSALEKLEYRLFLNFYWGPASSSTSSW